MSILLKQLLVHLHHLLHGFLVSHLLVRVTQQMLDELILNVVVDRQDRLLLRIGSPLHGFRVRGV